MSREQISNSSPLRTDAIPIEIQCADLIGQRLLNIYGYQQHSLAVLDLDDDESSWWLEFEGNIWATVKSFIPPVFIDTTFGLQFRFYHAMQFPLSNSAAFTKNPPELAPLLGLQLLEQMESLFDSTQLFMRALRLGFGNSDQVTTELLVGYLDTPKDEFGQGMAAKAIALETSRRAKQPLDKNIDRLMSRLLAISKARQEKNATEQRAFWQSGWATPFHVARKITGVLLIILGLVLLWEMVTMLSSNDYTLKVLFGFGGVALMLIIGGVLCLITKRGEDALK